MKRSTECYGNVLIYHDLVKSDSILRSKFIKENPDGQHLLDKLIRNNKVTEQILAQSATIKIKYQNRILSKSSELLQLPTETSYDGCLELLNRLYDCYDWETEESGGKKPLVRSRESLAYYAVLMNAWINSKPLNVIIRNTINDFSKNYRLIYFNDNHSELFDKNNRKHVNRLINSVVSDIDNILRFKIKNYTTNYSLLLEAKDELLSENNWSDFLEYGTTDSLTIELQNIGFPRHLATFLKKNYSDYFIIEDSVIVDFKEIELKLAIDKKAYNDEYNEIIEILN